MEASSQEVEENAQSEDLPDLKSGVQLEAVGKEAHLNEEAVSPLNGESVNSEEGNGQSVKDPIIPDVEFKEEKQSISPISPTPSDSKKENETVENKSDEMLNENDDISSMNSIEENNTEAKSVQEDIMSKNSMTQETSLDHNEDSEVLNQTDEDGEKVEFGSSPDVGETKDSDHISGVGEEKARGEIASPIVENNATEDQMSNEEDGEVKDVVDDSTSTFEAVQSKNNANEIENLQEVIKVDTSPSKNHEIQPENDLNRSESQSEIDAIQHDKNLSLPEKQNIQTEGDGNQHKDSNKPETIGEPDLIDVKTGDESDGEIVDSDEDENKEDERAPVEMPTVDYGLDDVRPEVEQLDYDEDVDDVGEIGETPQAPIEVEKKKPAEEMSDGEIDSSDGEIKSDNEEKGMPKKLPGFCPDDFEDGEMVDPMEGPAVPREICRFFEKGNCTWGDRCRFIHPGINDKGSYNLFAERNPLPPSPPRGPPPFDPRAPGPMHPHEMMHHPRMETAWERGLRHAKEMRRRAMQRKVQEPDFMRKREIISLNESLNVDRDLDYIVQKPLVDDMRGFTPFNAYDDDDRYAIPPPEELKRLKRFDSKSHDDRSPPRRPGEGHRRPDSPPPRGRDLPPPGHPIHRDMHRGMDRRSPPRHMGPHPHDRPPMFPRDRPPPHDLPPHMRDPGFRPERGGPRMDRDYRDRRMEDMMRERDRMDQRRMMDDRRLSPGQQRREVESHVVPVVPPGGPGNQYHKSPHPPIAGGSSGAPRTDNWSDPWARGRQKKVRGRSLSGSSSSSSGSSSRSSSNSSYSSRSSSRSFSSSFSSSGSDRSPSPKKSTKKVLKKKGKAKEATNGKSTKTPKPVSMKLVPPPKKVAVKSAPLEVKAKVQKVTKPNTAVAAKPKPPPSAPQPAPVDRGRPAKKTAPKKTKPKKKKTDTSSSSEFSHSDSSASRSRSKGKGSSDSESGSSSSGSGSSSSDLSSSSDEDKPKKTKVAKVVKVKATNAKASKQAAPSKVAVPSKGKKDVKMTIINKPQQQTAKGGGVESRKRSAAAMSTKPAAKKSSVIANRRVELLEQLKVVENAILKKRAKLT